MSIVVLSLFYGSIFIQTIINVLILEYFIVLIQMSGRNFTWIYLQTHNIFIINNNTNHYELMFVCIK